MEYSTTENNIEQLDVDGIIVAVYEDLSTTVENKAIDKILNIGNFQGKKNKRRMLFQVDGISAPMVVLMGLGKRDKLDGEDLRKTVAQSAKDLRTNGAKTIAVGSYGNAQAVAEGIRLGLYTFDELKKKKDEDEDNNEISEVIFTGTAEETAEWNRGLIIADGQNKARRLGELPANIATPSYFVAEAEKYFEDIANTSITSYDEDWAKEQNMGAFLSVAKGTDEPAKMLIIEYNGGNDGDQPLALVGKGITFDTGGINIKSASGMYSMRYDCSGAAVVIGTIYSIAKLGLPINAVAVAPLTENMPSGKASRPSDVVVASNGKSIEIGNTDAEGRLVLTDALVYTEKTYHPHTIVDVATLTGSMARAIGSGVYIGALSRSDELWSELETAGKQSGEEFWRFPLDKRYEKLLKSTLADVKSTGGNPGQIVAALYLGNFVEMERWVHLDIAGNASSSKSEGYKIKGNTGVPVRALVQLAANMTQ